MIPFIMKRDGRKVAFNEQKISNAIRKAVVSVHQDARLSAKDEEVIAKLCALVVADIEKHLPETPTVEHTQDLAAYEKTGQYHQ